MAYDLSKTPTDFLLGIHEALKKYDNDPSFYKDAVIDELQIRGLIKPTPTEVEEEVKTPWEAHTNFKDGRTWITDHNGTDVCDFYHRIKDPEASDKQFYRKVDDEKNAKLVVHCVNTHDELVTALKEAHNQLVTLMATRHGWSNERINMTAAAIHQAGNALATEKES